MQVSYTFTTYLLCHFYFLLGFYIREHLKNISRTSVTYILSPKVRYQIFLDRETSLTRLLWKKSLVRLEEFCSISSTGLAMHYFNETLKASVQKNRH